MSQKKFDPLQRMEEFPSMFYMMWAIVVLAIYSALCTYTEASPPTVGLILIVLYGGVSLTVYLLFRRHMKQIRSESDAAEQQQNSILHAFRDHINFPYAVVTEDGKIVTVNQAFRRAAGREDSLFGENLSAVCDLSADVLPALIRKEADDSESSDEAEEESLLAGKSVLIGDRKYRLECFPILTGGQNFYFLTFDDITELSALNTLHRETTAAVAYIVLDNLDELAQYVKVSYQNETRDVEAILRAWALSMGAMMLEYDRNKYVMFFSRKEMASCIKNRFEILDRIRNIRLGASETPITVSMGISILGNTLAEREKDALVALDMALLRGGDQVALKNENGTFFFGGRTKSPQKKSKTDSRVVTAQLISLIQSSPNVVIMGHSNPDFDSIGACVGLAALCLHLNVKAKIVMDMDSDNFKVCTERLRELADYRDIFVDSTEGLELLSFGTLLIVADANRFEILEAPEIAKNSFKTAIVDHHIKQQFEQEPQLSYIDHTASSACELVSEMLEDTFPEGKLRSEEANVMMSGIMVDTKNFTRNVGPRTFSAALYLRNAGANTEYAQRFFNQSFEDYRSAAQFGSEAHIYRNRIAITSLENSDAPNSRVCAAQAADRLLTVRNIQAAFALVRIGNVIHISARSNGSINVQLILEKIGGGGHFDMAGAALADFSSEEAERVLCQAIDDYLDDSASKSEHKNQKHEKE